MQRGGGLTESKRLELLRQVPAGIAAQFGSGCEVVVHDLSRHPDHSIVAIFNGHVTGRKVGDGASMWCWSSCAARTDHQRPLVLSHQNRRDGKILKSSTIYIRNSRGKVAAILAINYDISRLMMVENAPSRT